MRQARLWITIATAIYGVLPLLADLSETHVLKADWPPHARFHTVWLLATNAGVAALALFALWRSGAALDARLRLAGALGVCVLGGFCVAAATMPLYSGALSDPQGGVPTLLGFDANLIVFVPLLGLVLAGLWRGTRADAS